MEGTTPSRICAIVAARDERGLRRQAVASGHDFHIREPRHGLPGADEHFDVVLVDSRLHVPDVATLERWPSRRIVVVVHKPERLPMLAEIGPYTVSCRAGRKLDPLIEAIRPLQRIARADPSVTRIGRTWIDLSSGWGVSARQLFELPPAQRTQLAQLLDSPEGCPSEDLGPTPGAVRISTLRLRTFLGLTDRDLGAHKGRIVLFTREPPPTAEVDLPRHPVLRLLTAAAMDVRTFDLEDLEPLIKPEARAATDTLISAERLSLVRRSDEAPYSWRMDSEPGLGRHLDAELRTVRNRRREWIRGQLSSWLQRLEDGPAVSELQRTAHRHREVLTYLAREGGSAAALAVLVLARLPTTRPSEIGPLFDQVRSQVDSRPERLRLLCAEANHLRALSRFEEAAAMFDDAEKLAVEPAECARVLLGRALIANEHRQTSKIAPLCERALALPLDPNTGLYVAILQVLSIGAGDPDKRQELATRAIVWRTLAGDDVGAAIAYGQLGLALAQRAPATRTHLETAIRLLRGAGEQRLRATFLTTHANLTFARDAFEAEREYREALDVHIEWNNAKSEAMTRTNLAALLLVTGRIEEAMTMTAVAVDVARSSSNFVTCGNALGVRAHGAAVAGRGDEAVELFDMAVREFDRVPAPTSSAIARASGAAVSAAMGLAADLEGALAQMRARWRGDPDELEYLEATLRGAAVPHRPERSNESLLVDVLGAGLNRLRESGSARPGGRRGP